MSRLRWPDSTNSVSDVPGTIHPGRQGRWMDAPSRLTCSPQARREPRQSWSPEGDSDPFCSSFLPRNSRDTYRLKEWGLIFLPGTPYLCSACTNGAEALCGWPGRVRGSLTRTDMSATTYVVSSWTG